jgi:hypothetical protein
MIKHPMKENNDHNYEKDWKRSEEKEEVNE